jgi:hypothetical protein
MQEMVHHVLWMLLQGKVSCFEEEALLQEVAIGWGSLRA